MPVRADVLISKEQTGRAMHRLVGRYASDLDKFGIMHGGRYTRLSRLPFGAFHRVIREIPYRRDVSPIEVVARPARLLGNPVIFADCKKKSILVAAWAKRNYIPYRFVASSRRRDRRFHHVFPQFYLQGEWVNVDATYRNMRPGEVKRVTAAEVI